MYVVTISATLRADRLHFEHGGTHGSQGPPSPMCTVLYGCAFPQTAAPQAQERGILFREEKLKVSSRLRGMLMIGAAFSRKPRRCAEEEEEHFSFEEEAAERRLFLLDILPLKATSSCPVKTPAVEKEDKMRPKSSCERLTTTMHTHREREREDSKEGNMGFQACQLGRLEIRKESWSDGLHCKNVLFQSKKLFHFPKGFNCH